MEEGEFFPVSEEEEGPFPFVDVEGCFLLLEGLAETFILLEPEWGTSPLLAVARSEVG